MSRIRANIGSGESSPFVAGVAALGAEREKAESRSHWRVRPFVTITRQAGAGGWTLARGLIERLNEDVRPGERPWEAYDDELIDKVARDHKLSKSLIENLDDRTPSWIEDFAANLTHREYPSSEMIYQRVAATICGLAQEGGVVIVGRGGVHITREMPGGIHLRLIAPLEYRVEYLAEKQHLSKKAAADRVRELDIQREEFDRRYCVGGAPTPELFTLTMNTAAIPDPQMVECVLPLVKGLMRQRA